MRKMPVKVTKAVSCQLSAVSLVLLIVSYCYAAPCVGIKMPEAGKFSSGLQSHYIFNRYLEKESGRIRSAQHFLLLSYGLFERFSVDLKGGAGYIKQHPADSDEIDYSSNFAGGYGFRLKFYDKEKLSLIFGFQHVSVHPKSLHLGNVKHQAVLDDWQLSLLAGKQFAESSLYAGAKLSRLDYIHWDAGERKRTMSDLSKGIGMVLGFDLAFTQKLWLNIEGQFIDSEAVALSLNYKW